MKNMLFKKDIISISDLSRDAIELILNTAAELKHTSNQILLKDKVVASCFFEPSTRTRISFEVAIQKLGGSCVGFADDSSTSLVKKGETLADTIKVISSYVDAIVMRHPEEGSAKLASEYSSVPIINGGDGANQHPTQTLLDLFSIKECQGKIDNIKVALVGDLKYGRTVHSLAQALSLFNVSFSFLSPSALAMPGYILDELDAKGIKYSKASAIKEIVPTSDVIYMTRIQQERFDEAEFKHVTPRYMLTNEILKTAPAHLKVLHPLPRNNEINVDVDSSPHAYYFQQAQNGIYTRQALLALILNKTI
ncbi:MAG: aspartate carbamoyltransferase [Candidatus Endonucleobacter bathymodioli]|uniref:Aspartate carbamoyltransferase n=1 Tax=Candidatus Endonucleibacter bathymodioli TaxID=539814 RepID=A0AA90NKQ7_9GAMM|nr:aspartate carbamoyltransferase [Candidatus Endonucleobacter bathymodioli]